MYDAKRPARIRDSLTTIGAVWLAASIGGMVPSLSPWSAGGQAASLLIYTLLLAMYARWTKTGRRSTAAYFVAGLILPVFVFALFLFLLSSVPHSFLDNGGLFLFSALGVGFQVHGGPDTPLEAYVPMTYLNIFLPIFAVIGGRAFLRYHRPA
jgi:hypothetical protein